MTRGTLIVETDAASKVPLGFVVCNAEANSNNAASPLASLTVAQLKQALKEYRACYKRALKL